MKSCMKNCQEKNSDGKLTIKSSEITDVFPCTNTVGESKMELSGEHNYLIRKFTYKFNQGNLSAVQSLYRRGSQI